MKNKKKENYYFSFLRDKDGKLSRKAIAGFFCIFTYIYLLLEIIDNKIILTKFHYSLLINLLWVGGSLLGLSIFEWLRLKK